MRLAFILDPLESLKAYKDSSIAMMRAAQAAGHAIWAIQQPAIHWSPLHGVCAEAVHLEMLDANDVWHVELVRHTVPLRDFTAVLMRKDPPFDMEYVTTTWLLERAESEGARIFNDKLDLAGKENFMQFMRAVLLQTLDSTWRDHLAALDYLRQGIHLRGYAQKQPKQEYKREAFELFRQLIDQVKNQVTRVMMQVQIRSPEQLDEATEQLEQSNERMSHVTYSGAEEPSAQEAEALEPLELPEGVRVGRNDPCPCGSGLKFKQCHGKLA